MAHLSGLEVEAVKADLEGVARDVAKRFNAVILLKGQESLLAEPSGEIFVHRGGTVGLATGGSGDVLAGIIRSEEHTSELQSLMRISYAVFCLQKKKLQIARNN